MGELIYKTSNDDALQKFKIDSDDIAYFSEQKITKAQPVVLVFSVNGEDIGFVKFDLRVFNRNAYITYYVVPKYRGQGYGKAMLKKAIEFAFGEMNLHRLTAEVYAYNEKSIRLLESLGFVREGLIREAKFHDNKYWDILIMGVLKEEARRK
ncbi:GNAT family N-acetyltransferase [Fervidobacterium gondwanense]|uniref:Acetyltransferase (GNAT) family protein n=1 Tax=Fervidobacterium gondwanense DSM 13020 TaxID=1121883 RepID=A0A1M7TG03_FERGO|nr:GNAT family protein [Fervidobacterium gondwanense]SHN69538.1 Acetyltransferase (GNAT) family protein [Fervidobacterium gondwanense DSM 13020]